MDFLIFYIISTIIIFLMDAIIIKSASNQLRREYPDFKEKQKQITISEKISDNLILIIPVFNIIIILIAMFNQNGIKDALKASVLGREKKEEKNERYLR